MHARTILSIAAILLVIGCPADAKQSVAAFAQAVSDQSTSPFFVKIVVIDSRTGRSFPTCVTANFFVGALHIEHGLPYTDAGSDAAEKLAMSAADHKYRFSSSKALRNMPSNPTSKDLADAAFFVSKAGSLGKGGLSSFYQNHERREERMGALACALIDRGLKPRLADISGSLYVQE